MSHLLPEQAGNMRATMATVYAAAGVPLPDKAYCPHCRMNKDPNLMLHVTNEENIPGDFICVEGATAVEQETKAAETFQEKLAYKESLPYAKIKALTELGRIRWENESGGFVFNGTSVLLNSETQSRIANALQGMALKLTNDPESTPTVDWQVSPGVFISLDMPSLTAMGLAAYDHIQQCFCNAKVLSESIMSADSKEEVKAIDLEVGWP